jgi:putative hydrolase of the HAD superfamily
MTVLPTAILFDLDDTILSAYSRPELAWQVMAEEFAEALGPIDSATFVRAVLAQSIAFWADPADHKHWRMRLDEARRRIVGATFDQLAREHGVALRQADAARMAERFNAYRDEVMCPFPGACETIDALKRRGVRLALVTNGPGPQQRAKVKRFELAHRFDHIQIEGEHGFGKPEERAYLHAMQALGVAPNQTWMVGDNLEWEVAAPQRLGIYGIWHDVLGQGLPPGSAVRPDRIIRSLTELLPLDGS